MLRLLTLALALSATAAAAQGVPTLPNTQPGAPALPASVTDPNTLPGAPPAFVPGVNGNDTPPVQRPNAVRISGGVMAGLLVNKVDPMYPADAQGMAGTVVLSARIGKDGHILSLAAVTGPRVFQSAALSAVKQWTYKPYMLNGEPVDVLTTITVAFNAH